MPSRLSPRSSHPRGYHETVIGPLFLVAQGDSGGGGVVNELVPGDDTFVTLGLTTHASPTLSRFSSPPPILMDTARRQRGRWWVNELVAGAM
jgi:hypothetical protein